MWTRTLRPVVIFLLGMTLLAACTQSPQPATEPETAQEAPASTPYAPMPAAGKAVTPTHHTETEMGGPASGQTLQEHGNDNGSHAGDDAAPCQGPQGHRYGEGRHDHLQGKGPQGHKDDNGNCDGHGPWSGIGPDNPWRTFHKQPIPQAFAGLENPIAPDDDSLAKGKALYEAQCVSCHGETGMGDGPAAASLNPPPAPIARTACRMSDAYLFWRISEGGAQWGTAMPAFGNTLSEEDIWHLVNYIRSLGACP